MIINNRSGAKKAWILNTRPAANITKIIAWKNNNNDKAKKV